jgi:cbb3-type cytochrome oxidase cytochrome c subunit
VKNGFHVFVAAFIALGLSWCGFVLWPAMQLGTAKQTAVLNSSDVYPLQPTGAATLGLQVYRANGCAACHTEQVRQEGVTSAILLTSLGKNPPEGFRKFVASLLELPEFGSCSNAVATQLQSWNGKIPSVIATNLDAADASDLLQKINTGGCKSEIQIIAVGPDISRGWGPRRSVAADFLYDNPVQLGSLRAGPDLVDVGGRLANAGWQLQHLYAPRSLVKDSAMPPFRYLFELRKIGDAPSPDALVLTGEFAPPTGYEVVPTDDAKNLAAYLLSLRANVPLYEAPFTPQ